MTTQTLTKKFIDEVFTVCQTQSDALLALYRAVFPNWDRIKQVKGFPECNENLSGYLCKKFMDFDRKHHPNVMAGGIWLNNGFGSLQGKDLPDWTVRPCEAEMVA